MLSSGQSVNARLKPVPITEENAQLHEARSRLVKVKRMVAAQRSQHARDCFAERKRQDAQAVRSAIDELSGRHAIRNLLKVHAADEMEVRAISEALNDALVAQSGGSGAGAPGRSRLWIELWREMDDQSRGRVEFSDFSSMLRRKLGWRGQHCRLGEIENVLQALWRYLDDDGHDQPVGCLVLSQYLAFMKMGVDEQNEAATAVRRSWRQRLEDEKRLAALAFRNEQRQRESELRHQRFVSPGLWRRSMHHVVAASTAARRQLASALCERLGLTEGWYSLYKTMDVGGLGKVSWDEWHDAVLSRLPRADEEHDPRGVWRAMDPDLAGFVSLPVFRAWVQLGVPTTARRSERQGQLEARRARVLSLKEEESSAHEFASRSREAARGRLEAETQRLELDLKRLRKEEGRQARRLAGAGAEEARASGTQTDRLPRIDYRVILATEPKSTSARAHYLGNKDGTAHRRRLHVNRQVNERFKFDGLG